MTSRPRLAVAASALMLSAATIFTAPVATAAPIPITLSAHKHACTRTSSGSCIRGGEFCPQRDYNHSGWDAKGRRYVCKGSRVHPHWEKP